MSTRQKEFYLKRRIFTNILKQKLHELFKVKAQLREDDLKLTCERRISDFALDETSNWSQ